MRPPDIRTDRLILRGHGLADYGDVLRVWSNPQVVEHISGVPDTAETAWAKLMFHIGHWTALGFGYWAVTDMGGAYLGMVGFCVLPRLSEPPLASLVSANPIEAGWAFAPEAQGHGYATEAMTAALSWADRQQAWPETVALVANEHLASHRLAARLGYTTCGAVAYQGRANTLLRRPRGQVVNIGR